VFPYAHGYGYPWQATAYGVSYNPRPRLVGGPFSHSCHDIIQRSQTSRCEFSFVGGTNDTQYSRAQDSYHYRDGFHHYFIWPARMSPRKQPLPFVFAILTLDKVHGQKLRPIGLFYLLLISWELVQGIAWSINARWYALGGVEMGTTCITQGRVFTLHEMTAPMTTL
jgi:hypothetical protein